MPKPKKNEVRSSFVSRYMKSKEAQKSFPDSRQRTAVAISIWNERNKKK